MNIVIVVRIKNGVVYEAYNCGADAALAESIFLKECRDMNAGFDLQWTSNDISAMMDDGYYEHNTECVCITWPTEVLQEGELPNRYIDDNAGA